MKKYICYIVVVMSTAAFSTTPVPASAEQYVCQVAGSVGWELGYGVWSWDRFADTTSFLVDTDLNTVRELGEAGWQWVSNQCEIGRVETFANNTFMNCQDFSGKILVNLDLLRFTFSINQGFVTGDDWGITPTIAIGDCAELGS